MFSLCLTSRHILDLGTNWGRVISFTPWWLYLLDKEHPLPIPTWWESSPRTQWHEKRTILPLLGLELCSLGNPAHSQSLYWLFYPHPLICQNNGTNWGKAIGYILWNQLTGFLDNFNPVANYLFTPNIVECSIIKYPLLDLTY
jgi:hypothetical protein